MGTQRKDPESLKSLLADIRNYGTISSEYTSKLLFNLTGEKVWLDSQCENCFEAILRYYIDDDKLLRLMLAVSGLSDGYRIIKKVTERREKYLEYLIREYNDERIEPDSLKKNEEDYCLEYIAKQLQKARDNKTIHSLVKQWTSETNNTQKAYADVQNIAQSEIPQTDKQNIYITINGGIHDSNVNLGNSNKINQEKKDTQNTIPTEKLKDKRLQKIHKTCGWGPERPTYTNEAPADHATFNSITNNPVFGDERDFVRIVEKKGDGEQKDVYSNDLHLKAGKQYEVVIYYHNNASATVNDEAHDFAGMAYNAKVIANFPHALAKGEKGQVSAIIEADGTDPESVWDEAYITADEAMTLHYVTASAKLHNDWDANGSTMSIHMFGREGDFLGVNELDGVIPGCYEFSGYITYTLQTVAEGDPIPDDVKIIHCLQ